MRQTLAVPQLARSVHAQWRCAREHAGWRVGPPDAAAKTSPYLKPITAFTELEWRRERWLALTDLLAIAAHAPTSIAAIEIPAETVGQLQREDRAPDIDVIAERAHAAWAAINHALGIADPRAQTSFHDLDDDAKSRSRANIACDIAAIAALTRSYVRAPLHILVCTDMIADEHICTTVLGALVSLDVHC